MYTQYTRYLFIINKYSNNNNDNHNNTYGRRCRE